MRSLMKAFMILVGCSPLAWADGLPLMGVYSEVDGNIVSISSQTMVKNDTTKLYGCNGKQVPRLPNKSYVNYELVVPSKGPVPVLKSVTEICN